jgi:hypothetical protein
MCMLVVSDDEHYMNNNEVASSGTAEKRGLV